jgi:hexosaminidase
MSRRDYKDFSNRLSHHYARLDYKGCNYRVPEPQIVSMKEQADGKLEFTLAPSVAGSEIVYTTDGRYPNIHSPRYTGPVTVDNKSDFHAMTLVTDRHYSLPIYFAPDYSAYKQYGTFTAEWKPLQIQTVMTPWRFECTGKISGNGTFMQISAGKLPVGHHDLFARTGIPQRKIRQLLPHPDNFLRGLIIRSKISQSHIMLRIKQIEL